MDYSKIEFLLKILGIIVSSFFAYHKFITKLIDKKVDKALYDNDIKHISQLRNEDNKTIFNKLESLDCNIGKLNENLIEILKKIKVD